LLGQEGAAGAGDRDFEDEREAMLEELYAPMSTARPGFYEDDGRGRCSSGSGRPAPTDHRRVASSSPPTSGRDSDSRRLRARSPRSQTAAATDHLHPEANTSDGITEEGEAATAHLTDAAVDSDEDGDAFASVDADIALAHRLLADLPRQQREKDARSVIPLLASQSLHGQAIFAGHLLASGRSGVTSGLSQGSRSRRNSLSNGLSGGAGAMHPEAGAPLTGGSSASGSMPGTDRSGAPAGFDARASDSPGEGYTPASDGSAYAPEGAARAAALGLRTAASSGDASVAGARQGSFPLRAGLADGAAAALQAPAPGLPATSTVRPLPGPPASRAGPAAAEAGGRQQLGSALGHAHPSSHMNRAAGARPPAYGAGPEGGSDGDVADAGGALAAASRAGAGSGLHLHYAGDPRAAAGPTSAAFLHSAFAAPAPAALPHAGSQGSYTLPRLQHARDSQATGSASLFQVSESSYVSSRVSDGSEAVPVSGGDFDLSGAARGGLAGGVVGLGGGGGEAQHAGVVPSARSESDPDAEGAGASRGDASAAEADDEEEEDFSAAFKPKFNFPSGGGAAAAGGGAGLEQSRPIGGASLLTSADGARAGLHRANTFALALPLRRGVGGHLQKDEGQAARERERERERERDGRVGVRVCVGGVRAGSGEGRQGVRADNGVKRGG